MPEVNIRQLEEMFNLSQELSLTTPEPTSPDPLLITAETVQEILDSYED